MLLLLLSVRDNSRSCEQITGQRQLGYSQNWMKHFELDHGVDEW